MPNRGIVQEFILRRLTGQMGRRTPQQAGEFESLASTLDIGPPNLRGAIRVEQSQVLLIIGVEHSHDVVVRVIVLELDLVDSALVNVHRLTNDRGLVVHAHHLLDCHIVLQLVRVGLTTASRILGVNDLQLALTLRLLLGLWLSCEWISTLAGQ